MLTESLLIDSNQPHFFEKKTKTLSTGELGLGMIAIQYENELKQRDETIERQAEQITRQAEQIKRLEGEIEQLKRLLAGIRLQKELVDNLLSEVQRWFAQGRSIFESELAELQRANAPSSLEAALLPSD